MKLGDMPAYPQMRVEQKHRFDGSNFPVEVQYSGLTIRQELAARFMVGLLSHDGKSFSVEHWDDVNYVNQANDLADALIASWEE